MCKLLPLSPWLPLTKNLVWEGKRFAPAGGSEAPESRANELMEPLDAIQL
jgi:hypothetical protein